MSEEAPPLQYSYAVNPSQRTLCVLVVDASESMSENDRINQVNQGLKLLERDLKADPVASMRVQVMLIECSGRQPTIRINWQDATHFTAPTLTANGLTPLGAACDLALEQIEYAKSEMRRAGVPWTRPWMIIMTDGLPTDDDWAASAGRVRDAIQDRKVLVWPFAVDDGDIDTLGRFQTPGKEVYRINGGQQFRDMFVWLSNSAIAASKGAADKPVDRKAPAESHAPAAPPPGDRIVVSL